MYVRSTTEKIAGKPSGSGSTGAEFENQVRGILVAERFRDSEFRSILLRFMDLHRDSDIPLSVQVTFPQKDVSEKRVAKLATEFGNYSSPLEKPAITVLSPLADIGLRLKSECNIFEVALMMGRGLQSVRVKFYYEVSSKKNRIIVGYSPLTLAPKTRLSGVNLS